MMQIPSWLELVNLEARLGQVRFALFDFDGTISVIRHGWEQIMIEVMLESIGNGMALPGEIQAEVANYVDQSTGILTIKQMKWLAQAVERIGLAGPARSALEYKQIYNQRLLQPVYERLAQIEEGQPENLQASRDAWMIQGVRSFLEQLSRRGVRLFLASGTDLEYVQKAAAALGVAEWFGAEIYGHRGDSETDSKEMVIQRILDGNGLHGPQLLVVGDGPVEIRYARQAGALALGVAADERRRYGLDERKRRRLLLAGADVLVTDFTHSAELASLLCGPV